MEEEPLPAELVEALQHLPKHAIDVEADIELTTGTCIQARRSENPNRSASFNRVYAYFTKFGLALARRRGVRSQREAHEIAHDAFVNTLLRLSRQTHASPEQFRRAYFYDVLNVMSTTWRRILSRWVPLNPPSKDDDGDSEAESEVLWDEVLAMSREERAKRSKEELIQDIYMAIGTYSCGICSVPKTCLVLNHETKVEDAAAHHGRTLKVMYHARTKCRTWINNKLTRAGLTS